MAKDSDPQAGTLENTGGLFSGFLAEENEFDRRLMWRLGTWGFAAVGAIVIAVMTNQAQLGWRREQAAAADLARQAQQIQQLARETQNEARRLATAIETLNNDRDRLYTRVTVLEQGLDSVTGTIAKQSAASTPLGASRPQMAISDPSSAPPSPAPQTAAPAVAPVASTPAAEKPRAETGPAEQATTSPLPVATAPAASNSLVSSKSIMSPPDPAATKLVQPEKAAKAKTETAPPAETAASPAVNEPEPAQAAQADLPKIPVQRTEFAVDLGSANSVGGLRALWRGLVKANPDLAPLHPIIMVRESQSGLGMQLRLGAGPLLDAAAAAKICATLAESERGCETTVFDGQRLAMKTEEKPQPSAAKSSANQQRRTSAKRPKSEDPPPAKPEPPSTLSSFFGRR
ncbi:MAG: hypothetical protein HY852_24605 [Bradyrhizobium sp.]|uniref:hypothetical protein n=1 Tax=Bradyrhizobium sp. TaxID=376 RepID=UPI0025B806AE|nr:hypothetical protein [Bradyrhizobium sp.]MBI5264988.1 hypothetical protein [Bradyrhizobium sp.]